jgi:mRNA-degrading endonuclease RelE of RelBE toxin-antitoxin system
MSTITISNRAKRDLRRIGPGPHRDQVTKGLKTLAEGAANLDIKALDGHAPWLRLRIGDYRALYRPIEGGWWVERVVNRRDLEQALTTL